MSESFSAVRELYLSSHENPVNSALHTLADVVGLGGLAAGVVTRRIRVVVIGDTVAFGIGTVAHLPHRGPRETTSPPAFAIQSGTAEPKATDSLVAAPNRPRRWGPQANLGMRRETGKVSQYRAEME
jgi:hypothetical protein